MAKLNNEVALGLHLSAGTSDGYITSAEYIYDETKNQKLQATLDALEAGSGYVLPIASTETIGGIKVQSGGDFNISDTGLLSLRFPVSVDDEGDNTITLNEAEFNWNIPTTSYVATTEHSGLLSVSDKNKLDSAITDTSAQDFSAILTGLNASYTDLQEYLGENATGSYGDDYSAGTQVTIWEGLKRYIDAKASTTSDVEAISDDEITALFA